MPNLVDLAKQELQKRNILKAVQQTQQPQIAQQTPELISQSDYDTWRNSLNPADYQTQLTPEETQQFTDWAAKGNVPITDDYDMAGYWKNEVAPYSALEGKFTPEQIAAARQGLNGGNADLAKFINTQGIRTPQTIEELVAAKRGEFNPAGYDEKTQHFTDKYKTPLHDYFSNESIYAVGDNAKYAGKWDGEKFISPVKQAVMKDIVSKIGAGLSENINNDFQMDNLKRDPNKSGWNRLGEALGTGYRLASNPAVQGLLAGAIYGGVRKNAGEGLKYGFDWAQNKAKSDYYAKAMGITRPNILGGYGADDFNAYSQNARRQFQNVNDAARTEAYTENIDDQIKNRAEKLILDKQKAKETKNYHNGMLKVANRRVDIAAANSAETKRFHDLSIAVQKERIAQGGVLKASQINTLFKTFKELNTTDDQVMYIKSLAKAAGATPEEIDDYLKQGNTVEEIFEMELESLQTPEGDD